MAIVADRAMTTRQTVGRIERGDPTVAMGTWATVLFALGIDGILGKLAAPEFDHLGMSLETQQLPQRVRLASRTAPRTRTGEPIP